MTTPPNQSAPLYPKDWSQDYYDSTITMMITPPYSGWVTLVFLGTPRGGLVGIDCSCVYDPLPGLVRWVHKIASNDLPARVSVNEEGYSSVLFARPIPGRADWFEFQINRCTYKEAKSGKGIQKFLSRTNTRQFVREFCRRVEQWQKEDCKGSAWEPRKWDASEQGESPGPPIMDITILKKFAATRPNRSTN